jgi:hypothetical protein
VDADMKTADQLHADDFQLSPLGGTLSKSQYLGLVASGSLPRARCLGRD